jgi:hypothetical protein
MFQMQVEQHSPPQKEPLRLGLAGQAVSDQIKTLRPILELADTMYPLRPVIRPHLCGLSCTYDL